MGLTFRSLELVEKTLTHLNLVDKKVKMGELGSQTWRKKTFLGIPRFEQYNVERIGAKKYFESIGFEHVSFDISGQHDCLYTDLSKIQDNWQGYFDIVTNFGTTEHVKNGQYEVFANVHNFVKTSGAMIHVVPAFLSRRKPYRGHPYFRCVHYVPDFFTKLAKLNGYDIFSDETHNGQIYSVLIKVNDKPFCSKKDFWSIDGVVDLSLGQSLTNEKYEI